MNSTCDSNKLRWHLPCTSRYSDVCMYDWADMLPHVKWQNILWSLLRHTIFDSSRQLDRICIVVLFITWLNYLYYNMTGHPHTHICKIHFLEIFSGGLFWSHIIFIFSTRTHYLLVKLYYWAIVMREDVNVKKHTFECISWRRI